MSDENKLGVLVTSGDMGTGCVERHYFNSEDECKAFRQGVKLGNLIRSDDVRVLDINDPMPGAKDAVLNRLRDGLVKHGQLASSKEIKETLAVKMAEEDGGHYATHWLLEADVAAVINDTVDVNAVARTYACSNTNYARSSWVRDELGGGALDRYLSSFECQFVTTVADLLDEAEHQSGIAT